MPPLTSPPGCNSCLHLSQRIAELEGRVSTVHQSCEDEHHTDSIVALATSRLAENYITLPWLGTTTIGEPEIVKAPPVPLEDPWPSLANMFSSQIDVLRKLTKRLYLTRCPSSSVCNTFRFRKGSLFWLGLVGFKSVHYLMVNGFHWS